MEGKEGGREREREREREQQTRRNGGFGGGERWIDSTLSSFTHSLSRSLAPWRFVRFPLLILPNRNTLSVPLLHHKLGQETVDQEAEK